MYKSKNEIEKIIKERHSVRSYLDKEIETEILYLTDLLKSMQKEEILLLVFLIS